MPTEAVDQVHRLAWCAKANKTLAFTNLRNEDLDVLYAGLGLDNDDNPDDNDATATGVITVEHGLANDNNTDEGRAVNRRVEASVEAQPAQ